MGRKLWGENAPQKKPSKKDYGYIKEKLTSSIHKGLTMVLCQDLVQVKMRFSSS